MQMYKRHREGASVDLLEREFGLTAEEISLRVEAARLCFEKQCPYLLNSSEHLACADR
jgi:hypothetical protein